MERTRDSSLLSKLLLRPKRPTLIRNSRTIRRLADLRAVQPRLHDPSLPSLVMHNPIQKERVITPLNLMPVKIQRMESLTTSSKPSLLSGKRARVSVLLPRKRVRANVPMPPREPDRERKHEPNLRKRLLRPVRARVKRPRSSTLPTLDPLRGIHSLSG